MSDLYKKNSKLLTAAVFLLTVCLMLPLLASCDESIKEDPKAEFSNQTRMFADGGIGIIMDNNFEKYYPDDCALACENGDLKFEAFYLEKYYFTENGRDIHSPTEALEYTNPGKSSGAVVQMNSYMQPYVEFVTPDTNGTENNIKMYYVCIEDEDGYWFCTFFAYEKYYEEYKPIFYDYLESLKTIKEE